MEVLRNLFEGYPNLWGGGVAHSVLILSLTIAFGIILAKIKVRGVSLGVTWILFVGIVFGHFNMNLDEHLLHFLKEFGLILFVYSIGLQVGPGFFSAFKKGGFTLNMLAMLVVVLGVTITIILHFTTYNHQTIHNIQYRSNSSTCHYTKFIKTCDCCMTVTFLYTFSNVINIFWT